jgi:hypothetical protein
MKHLDLQVLESFKIPKLSKRLRNNRKTESFNSSIFQQGYVWGEWGKRNWGCYRGSIERLNNLNYYTLYI